MNISLKWWRENGISADEGKETINAEYLTTVADVVIIPPDDRQLKNTDCHIYGDVSFRVGDTEVILFSRLRDNADHLFLSDLREGCSLCLSDHHESNLRRPLPAVSSSHPLRVKMKLKEKKGSREEDDVLIADTEHSDPGGKEDEDWCYSTDVPGLNGFTFMVSYSVAFGARAKVDVKIREEEGGVSPRKSILFSGKIVAYQYLEDIRPNFHNGISVTSLRKIHGSPPETLNVGESIALTRSFVVVPMRCQTYLGICIAPVINEESQDREKHFLYFPLLLNGRGSFSANRNLTHTKHFKHSSGIEFHVSITFCRPILGKRPRSSEHDHDDDGGVLN